MPGAEGTARPATTDLPSNVAAALACFPLIGGIIFYILEKRDGFVRFYAMQSIIFGAAWLLFGIAWRIVYSILAIIPAIGWVFRRPPLAHLGGGQCHLSRRPHHRDHEGLQRRALGYSMGRTNCPQAGGRHVVDASLRDARRLIRRLAKALFAATRTPALR